MVLKSKADIASYVLSFHPHFGEVLPNGNLKISWSGRGDDGELLDGYVEALPEYPDYAEWLEAINNKENYLREEKEKRVQEQAKRGEQYKAKPSGGQGISFKFFKQAAQRVVVQSTVEIDRTLYFQKNASKTQVPSAIKSRVL